MSTDNQFGGASKWIPVAQELPPEGNIVLTKLKDKYGTRFVRFLTRCAGDWYNTNDDITDYPPTHWARD